MRFGDFGLVSLSDGFFGLDGGAMFGVVPRPVWQKLNPPDERNRIRLALRPLLVVTQTERILIETGIGDKGDARFNDLYRVEKPDTLRASLARAGFTPEDITRVVLTHLHFDHCGGSTERDPSGRIVPTFPNARHYVHKAEWDLARNPNRRSRAAYLPENYLPLAEAGMMELVEADRELVPGIELVRVGGHTPGLMLPFIRSEGRTALYWSDLLPTASHVATPYITGYDLLPLETMEQKERLVSQAAAQQWLCFPGHDTELAAGRLALESGRYALCPLPPE
jgi:glyoxylase-like metal-dependent hydrolase (beta-lactamase superfamily II)